MTTSWFTAPPDKFSRLIQDENFNSHLAARASRNILGLNQAYTTHLRNMQHLFELEEDFQGLARQIPKYESKRELKLDQINQSLHNYLSSMYSLRQSVEETFGEMKMLGRNKYRIRKYRDNTRIAHGLRVYVQHRGPLNLLWMIESDGVEELSFHIGVWLSDIIPAENDIYHAKTEQGGNKVPGVKYHFDDVENGFIELFPVIRSSRSTTQDFYESSISSICSTVTDRIEEFDEDIQDYLYEQGTTLPDDLTL